LEVGTPTALNQQCVAGKYPVITQISEVSISVAGCVQRLQGDIAYAEGLAFFDA